MWKQLTAPWALLTGVTTVGLLLATVPTGADARPKYRSLFKKEYKKVAENNKISCDVCHVPDKEKTERNHYGEAVLKTLKKLVDEIPERGLKDEKKIKEMLKKTEKEKSKVKDKTFGDLLKEGKLPASK